MEYKLLKPITFDGEKIESLNLDFEKLFYKDLVACEQEAEMRMKKDKTSVQLEWNTFYLLCVAAKASGVMTELMLSLKAKDATAIKSLVQKFLMSDKSELDEETGKYKLIYPISFEGELVEELTFEFDDLGFADIQSCETAARKKARKGNRIFVSPEFDTTYLLLVATKASNVSINLLQSLRADDFTNIKIFTQSFLASGVLEVED